MRTVDPNGHIHIVHPFEARGVRRSGVYLPGEFRSLEGVPGYGWARVSLGATTDPDWPKMLDVLRHNVAARRSLGVSVTTEQAD